MLPVHALSMEGSVTIMIRASREVDTFGESPDAAFSFPWLIIAGDKAEPAVPQIQAHPEDGCFRRRNP